MVVRVTGLDECVRAKEACFKALIVRTLPVCSHNPAAQRYEAGLKGVCVEDNITGGLAGLPTLLALTEGNGPSLRGMRGARGD